MPSHANRVRALTMLLRLAGVVTSSAFLAMLLPTDWMAATHQRLGFGEFPRIPVMEYLTRSIAALYGFHGGLLLLIARNPIKHIIVVRYVAFMNVALGVMLLVIDLEAGLPEWWTLVEGPPIILVGIAMAILARSADNVTR